MNSSENQNNFNMNNPNCFDWIEKWALYTPNNLVFKDHNSNRSWTYYEFNLRTTALANYLKKEFKLKKKDRLLFYSINRPEHVFFFFACIKIGVIFVPLNFRLTPNEIDYLVTDSDPSLFVYDITFEEKVNKLKSLKPKAQISLLSKFSEFAFGKIKKISFELEETISADDVVLILYTSGTTGIPKGAMINHRMLFWNSINTELRLNINSNDHTQNFAPFFHTGAWNVLLTPFIHHGASLTLLSNFDPDLILRLIEEEKTTIFFGVPTMLQMMSQSPLFEKADISSIRYAVVGGAPMPIPLINKWHKKGVAIRQGYGLTEVGPNCFSLHQDDAIRKIGSIGFPNFYINAKIVDENGIECEKNEVGELCLKSPVVTPGYWNKPGETVKTIKDGWFYTGDMLRKDEEGYFYVVDRKKNMFISGGENIYPSEIEKIILSNEYIEDCTVIGVPDEKWDEVGKAFVVIKKNCNISKEQIIKICSDKLAKYKIPKYIQFIEFLPRNEAGKIEREKLKNLI